ncbi:MAG: hypothetical protein FWH46_04810 [Methanimicrococcus sp.]|nr:hypothetical protein [Methanimicrococcus sp.]
MQVGNFYCLTQDYFADLKDDNIKFNKEYADGTIGYRPFLCVKYEPVGNFYYMVPLTTEYKKY